MLVGQFFWALCTPLDASGPHCAHTFVETAGKCRENAVEEIRQVSSVIAADLTRCMWSQMYRCCS